jgi:hypothetical protein
MVVLLLWQSAVPAQASVATWQQGATITSRFDRDFESESFKQSVINLHATGANFVTLVIPQYQSHLYATDIQAGWNTPPDTTLIAAIQFIHSQGMSVMLKPHLESYDGQWRAYINPGERATWFKNYGDMIVRYATIAQQQGVEEFCIGTELISMASASTHSDNTQAWKDLIGRVRAVYSGKVTYSANWGPSGFVDEKNNIQFWSQLDHIGLSGYFNLTSDYNNDVQFLKNAWDTWNREHIKPLSDRFGKPVVFTEVGYKSVDGAHTQPWNYNLGGNFNEQEQARSYEALFSYWNDHSFMQGVQLWDWSSDPNAGGQGNTDYTPQRKAAEATMQAWFGATPPPPSGGGGGSSGGQAGTFTVSAQASQNLTVSQSANVNVQVSNSGASLSNALVDVEVYASNGTKVFQKFFENQSLSTNQTLTYTASWTPAATGTYTLKVGIFNGNWTTNYFWGDSVLSVNVGSGGTATPPPSSGGGGTSPSSGELQVWWPTNGATVSGTQPFKAMLTGLPVEQYSMFWQVDGDRLNDMFNDYTGYPHKEVTVDVSGWSWRGTGPYRLNVVAKDFAAGILQQKQLDINISH